MPRSQPTGLTNLLPECETQSTVDIALRDGTNKFFCTGDTNLVLGDDENTYETLLKRVGELKESLGQSTNRVEVKVSNVDGEFGLNVASSLRKMELADVVIRRFYRNLEDPNEFYWMHFFTGKAVSGEADRQFVSFAVIPDTTAAGTCIATETLSPSNGWKFPETPEQSPPGSGDNPDTSIPCFTAGTLVSTPYGQMPIEALKKGWFVYSFDENTRDVKRDRIAETLEHLTTDYFEFVFSDESRISVTPEHRFLTEAGEWLAADRLKLGQTVWKFVDGVWRPVALQSFKWQSDDEIPVYNLHVVRNHNYFANEFAVHNAKDPRDL